MCNIRIFYTPSLSSCVRVCVCYCLFTHTRFARVCVCVDVSSTHDGSKRKEARIDSRALEAAASSNCVCCSSFCHYQVWRSTGNARSAQSLVCSSISVVFCVFTVRRKATFCFVLYYISLKLPEFNLFVVVWVS